MPDAKRALEVAGEWVKKAENDLTTAIHTLKLGDDCPTDTVCFHAQQCIEKYLKAMLVLQCAGFPKTHSLEQLMAILPAHQRPRLDPTEQERITQFATEARYPGWTDVPLEDALWAVGVAKRVRQELRKHFPRTARHRKPKRTG